MWVSIAILLAHWTGFQLNFSPRRRRMRIRKKIKFQKIHQTKTKLCVLTAEGATYWALDILDLSFGVACSPLSRANIFIFSWKVNFSGPGFSWVFCCCCCSASRFSLGSRYTSCEPITPGVLTPVNSSWSMELLPPPPPLMTPLPDVLGGVLASMFSASRMNACKERKMSPNEFNSSRIPVRFFTHVRVFACWRFVVRRLGRLLEEGNSFGRRRRGGGRRRRGRRNVLGHFHRR